MRGVIELDGGDRMQVFGINQDEIDMFASDGHKKPVACRIALTRHFKNIRDTNLGEYGVTAIHRAIKCFVEILFGRRQKSVNGFDVDDGFAKPANDQDDQIEQQNGPE
jgi:hypothetical protein